MEKTNLVLGLLILVLSACTNATPTALPEKNSNASQGLILPAAQPSTTPTAVPSLTATATPTALTIATAAPVTATSIWYKEYYPYYTCADSAYIKDMSIPDGTVLVPGQTFVKTWKFRNTGSCTWTEDYELAPVKGDDMGGDDTSIDDIVSINKNSDISIILTAPDDPGRYYGYWQLQDDYGYTFGDRVYVEIVVVAPTSTANAVPTSTPRPTATPTTIAYP